MKEKQLQTAVLKYLRTIPNSFWINLSPSPYSRSGLPDIVGCKNGFFYAIELKQPGKYKNPADGLSEAQSKVANEIDNADGDYYCADSLEAVKEIVR